MATGIEELLISGGAQWIIGRLATEVSDEVLPEIKQHLNKDSPDLAGAQQAAREYEVSAEFQKAIKEFEETTGVTVEEYSLEYSTDDE